MKAATSIFRHRLALAFDFHGTLGPSTFDANGFELALRALSEGDD